MSSSGNSFKFHAGQVDGGSAVSWSQSWYVRSGRTSVKFDACIGPNPPWEYCSDVSTCRFVGCRLLEYVVIVEFRNPSFPFRLADALAISRFNKIPFLEFAVVSDQVRNVLSIAFHARSTISDLSR